MVKTTIQPKEQKGFSFFGIKIRPKIILTYIVSFFFTVSVYLRNANGWHGEPTHPSSIYLLITFTFLLAAEAFITNRPKTLSHAYFVLQTIIAAILLYNPPHADYWSVLFIVLSLQAIHVFKPRIGFIWIGIFTIVMAVFILNGFGFDRGLPHILTYLVVNFGIGGLLIITNNAEAARKQIQEQQVELLTTQEALRKSEMEKAITAERSRLARELHDSVTQSLHSATLMAEAGQRLAGEGDLDRARGYLIRLGEISQQALREMRLLVYELRPFSLQGISLTAALQQRLDTVERRAGVDVSLNIDDTQDIPEEVEEELYWIAVEALNNALKHSNPSRIEISSCKEHHNNKPCFGLIITDDGRGFDTESIDEGGLGLVSMKERIEKLKGKLVIESSPGEGTQIKACLSPGEGN